MVRVTRLAVVGLGGISQSVHLPVIQRNRADVDLVALVELSRARLDTIAERYGVPAEGRFTSLDDLVAAIDSGDLAVDAAIIATGGGHTDEALALVRAGVKVLVEKPLGWSGRDLDTLENGFTEIGRSPEEWLRIGYMKEHDPAVAAAKALLADVTPREVRVEVLHPADGAQLQFAHLEAASDDVDPVTLAALSTRSQRSIDEAIPTADDTLRKLWTNVLLGSIVHDIALTRHLGLGLTDVIHARRVGDQFPGSVFAVGTTGNGVAWNLGWHFIADYPEYRETITVHHDKGTIELRFATPYVLNAPTVLRVSTGDDQLNSQVSEQTWPQEEAFERELRSLLTLASGGTPDGSSIRAARQDLASAQALWRACATSAGIDAETGSAAAHPA